MCGLIHGIHNHVHTYVHLIQNHRCKLKCGDKRVDFSCLMLPSHRHPCLLPLLCFDDVLNLTHQCLHVDQKQSSYRTYRIIITSSLGEIHSKSTMKAIIFQQLNGTFYISFILKGNRHKSTNFSVGDVLEAQVFKSLNVI